MIRPRLDHVIYSVPDIESAHRELTASLPEAWPIGRFWPNGRTSGVALGGLNLELIQLDESPAQAPVGSTLAFEPETLAKAAERLTRLGIEYERIEKYESDPQLLKLRGFDETMSATKQLICVNLVPTNPELLPFEFFYCDYSPFLKGHLSSLHPRLRTSQTVFEVTYGTPEPEKATRLLDRLLYRGSIWITFEAHADRRILSIRTDKGAFGWPG